RLACLATPLRHIFRTHAALFLPFVLSVVAFPLFGLGPHRDLHSFPTRRSSDLTQWVADAMSTPETTFEQVVIKTTGDITTGGFEDRKSTRLNSSHVSISYAVFCLKKKKCEHHAGDNTYS